MLSKLTPKTRKIILIVSILSLVHLISIVRKNKGIDEAKCNSNRKKYKKECFKLFKELQNPDPKAFYRPPLGKPPDDLLNEFTQNGEMPITKYWYFNEVYSDANQKLNENKEIIPKSVVDYFRLKDNNRAENQYKDQYNHQMMPRYSNFI